MVRKTVPFTGSPASPISEPSLEKKTLVAVPKDAAAPLPNRPNPSGVSGTPLVRPNCAPPSMGIAARTVVVAGAPPIAMFWRVNVMTLPTNVTWMLRRCEIDSSRAVFICAMHSPHRTVALHVRPGAADLKDARIR